jgi:hypothetical protein
MYGLRADLATAVFGTSFWMKAAFTIGIGVLGFLAVERMGRPSVRVNFRVALLETPFALILLLAADELAHAAPADRISVWLGETWRTCPFT